VSAGALRRSLTFVAIAAALAACGPTAAINPNANSPESGAAASSSSTANATPSATSASLTVIYQAINSSDDSIHEAVIENGVINDHIVVNDPSISFSLGFTSPSTIAVRKDAPGSSTTEVGTVDINTGAYHKVYSMAISPTHEMLGPELSPDGAYAAFEDQNGLSSDWFVLDMSTGQTRSLDLTHGGAVIAWTPSYLLFNSGSGLLEVDLASGARSVVPGSSDYDIASPNGSHLAGAIYRNRGDPQWCLNTAVTGIPGGPESVAAAGANSVYELLAVADTGDILLNQSVCGPGPQQAESPGTSSADLWRSGQVIQQFTASPTYLWANAKFIGDSSALMQRDTLTQENTPEGPGGVVTAAELDLVELCGVSNCQPSTLRIAQAQGTAAGYLYFAAMV
jgi:hypothetical protein